MRIAVSNIAWDVDEDEAIAALLASRSIDAIDVAPTKYFAPDETVTAAAVDAVRRWWSARGIEITGMQSLLFGTHGLNVFGPTEVQEKMLGRLAEVAAIARDLGASRLVFGSPKNRDRGMLSDDAANAIAMPFFNRLGDIAVSYGVSFCIEPNPPRYGCNFLTNSGDAAAFVRRVGHPAIAMHLDTGSIAISNEDPQALIRDNADIIGHIHISEPDLIPVADGPLHSVVAASLRQTLPRHVVSIEMLATREEPHPQSVERAVVVTRRYYGD